MSAIIKRRRSDRLKFFAAPANADAERQPSFGEEIDRGQQLSGQHRGPVRHHHDREHEAQLRRQRGDISGGCQLLQPRRLCPSREFSSVGVWVFRVEMARHHDVVADRHVIEAKRLTFGDDAGEAVWPNKGAGGGGIETDLHIFSPVALPAWRAPQASRRVTSRRVSARAASETPVSISPDLTETRRASSLMPARSTAWIAAVTYTVRCTLPG
jgi:hypothetical protein